MSATKLEGKQAMVYRLLKEEGPMTCRQIAGAMTRPELRETIARGAIKAYYNVLHKLRNRNAVALYGGGWFALPSDGIEPYTKYNRVKKPPKAGEKKTPRERIAALDTDHEHRQWLENVLQRREQKEKQLKWQARC